MTNDSVGSVECSRKTAKNLAMMHKFCEYFAVIAVKQFSPLVSCQCVCLCVCIFVCALLIKARGETTFGPRQLAMAMSSAKGMFVPISHKC